VALQYRPQLFVLINDVLQIKKESVLIHSNQHALPQEAMPHRPDIFYQVGATTEDGTTLPSMATLICG
jgi:hypothetical protein